MINIERVDYPFQYGVFALTEALDQFRFDTEINSMLESYDIIINEEDSGEKQNIFKRIWEAIKKFIGKIVDAIKGLFGKFKKNTAASSDEDKKFFEDNKDIILNRKTTEWAGNGGDTNITDYYDIKYEEIEKITVPDFDEQKIKSLADSNKDTVIAAFDNFSKYYKDKQKGLNDNVVSFILGEKTSIKASQLDMKKIYEFAIGIDTLSDKIQNAINKVDENAKKANVTIDKMIKENETIKNYGKEEKKDNNGNSGNSGNNGNGNSGNSGNNGNGNSGNSGNNGNGNSGNGGNGTKQESFSFNDTLLYYFSEVGVENSGNDNGNGNSGNSGNNGNGNSGNSGNNGNGNSGNSGNNDNGNSGNSGNNNSGNNGNNQEEQKLKQSIEMFWKLSADLVSAQFKVARQAYAQCRDLIRIHVDKINEADGKKNNDGQQQQNGGGDNGANQEQQQNGGGDNGANQEQDNGGGDNGGNQEQDNGGNQEQDNGGKDQQTNPLTAEEQQEYDKLIKRKNRGKLSQSQRDRLQKLEDKKNSGSQENDQDNTEQEQNNDQTKSNDNPNELTTKEKKELKGLINRSKHSKLTPEQQDRLNKLRQKSGVKEQQPQTNEPEGLTQDERKEFNHLTKLNNKGKLNKSQQNRLKELRAKNNKGKK